MSAKNSDPGRLEWHTYRCPVCGHTDEVDLAEGVSGRIDCSHCGTPLEVVVLDRGAAAAGVKVATRVSELPG
jgi:transcription elongation factor Elf1